MCYEEHPISRRRALQIGFGTAAALLAAPGIMRADVEHTELSDMEVALRAERWIRSARRQTTNGVMWPQDPLEGVRSSSALYDGMPGVIVFYLELFHATRDHVWLDEATRGADELIARLSLDGGTRDMSLYGGLAGAAFVLEETHRASGEGRYRDATKKILARIHNAARKTANGVAWVRPSDANDIISGTAGIGLALLWLDKHIVDPDSRALALAAGHELAASGLTAGDGLKWTVASGVKALYPNFSHGTAGVAYFLATLAQATGDLTIAGAALSGARYLEGVANTEAGGFKVFHHEPGGENLYYLSWCHGPAGSVHLFYRLAELTQDARWDALVRACARSTITAGVPEAQSPGYWNNISQCCGNAGVGEFFINLQARSPSTENARMIRRIAANTLERATAENDGLKWIQAENRVSPSALVAQTGYMQGAAGVGSFYLHADALTKGRKRAIQWPDAI
jgi:lantibiotic modifying enzyme